MTKGLLARFSLIVEEMVGEINGVGARAFLKPTLSSPEDCFSSKMDSPGGGGTDDVSSENDSVGPCTQVQKVRPKRLPVPVSVCEGKSDDLILSDNVSGKLRV